MRSLPANPERILVRAPNPVGDLVMATAALRDLRRGFPDARISLLLRPGREGIVAGLEYFDEVLLDDSKRGVRSLVGLARDLRRRRFDMAVLFTNSFRTALTVFLARVPARVGFRKGAQELFLTHRLEAESEGGKWKPRPMPEHYADLCRGVGVAPGDLELRLVVTDEEEVEARTKRRELGVPDGEELIGLVPGASFGTSKLWPAERFGDLADRLHDVYGRRTVIFCGPGEEEMAGRVAGAMRSRPVNPRPHPLGLRLLKPFVRDLKLLVTTDSGPRHYAAAFRVPTVVLMGPTHPRWAEVNVDRSEVVRHDVPCGPCQLPVCPTDHRCMLEIGVGEVLEAIDRLDRRLGVFR